MRIGFAQKWLDGHPDVPWTAEEFVREIDRRGQQRAAVDALAAGRHAIAKAQRRASD